MTDINRRGFLALLGATAAVATLPKALVVKPNAPEAIHISQGLYVKSRGIVHFLGNIEAISVEHEPAYDFSTLRGNYRQYIRAQNSNVTFDLVGELQNVMNARQLMYDILDSENGMKDFADYKMQVLAIMRHGHFGSKAEEVPAVQNNRLNFRAQQGDLIIAIDNTFMRDLSDQMLPRPTRFRDAADDVARMSTTFVMPSEGNYVSYYDENNTMKQLAGDRPALEHFGA